MIAYRKYLVVLLATIAAFSFTDRLALGVALQSIKLDLRLSDTQLGFLTGIAFAFFYATFGLVIGRWADRGNRATLIAVTTGLWSVVVTLTGMAASFMELLMIRVSVGVGEAGCMPTAYSLMSDSFSRSERPRAFGVYGLAGPASALLGYLVAGWLNQQYGWRVMFVVIGIPGIALTAAAAAVVREPRLLTSKVIRAGHTSGVPPMREVLRRLQANASYRNLLFALAVNYFCGWGILQWAPTFFIRTYGLKTAVLGMWFAGSVGVGGLVGTLLGGHLASRRAGSMERLQLRVLAVTNCVFGLISAAVYLSRNYHVSFALIGIANVVSTLGSGPIFSATEAVVPERMRAIAISIVFFFANLIGMGLGPLVVGVLSDTLRPVVGPESLRYALIVMGPGYLWGGWHLWRAARSVHRDIDLADVGHEGSATIAALDVGR
jgi:MFS family permease